MLIVHKVVEYLAGEYLAGNSKSSYSLFSSNYYKRKAILAPLVLVGGRWCVAALASICDTCELNFSHAREAIDVTFPAWPDTIPYSMYRKTRFVRRLRVHVNIWRELCDGTFCKVSDMSQYENLSFPSVRTLELNLNGPAVDSAILSSGQSSPTPTSEIGREQVASVAQALRRLVPMADSLDVRVRSMGHREPSFEQLHEWLAAELCYGRVSSFAIGCRINNYIMLPTLSNITGLTSIAHGGNVSGSPLARLAYLNAGTLKALDIWTQEGDWLDLIFDDANVPMVYTELVSLKLELEVIPYGTAWTAIETVVPFPALETLDIYGGYPFDDDLLFRGNGGTLRNMRLPFSALCRNVLGRFNVLKRSGVTRMSSIRISGVFDTDNEFVTANADIPFKKQVHRILEMSSSLALLGDSSDDRLFYSVLSAPKPAILQRLDIGNLLLNAVEVMEVVAAIPSLSSLRCRFDGYGQAIVSIPAKERPSGLHAKYYPLSQNFRTLTPVHYPDCSAKVVAHVAMLLAVVCPSFRAVEVPLKLREDFGREIAWCMINDTYKPYADRLKTLIYLE
ncbi:hypothetical protein IWW57_004071 [Coemansia sp. S610]|nr:hypothetical protein IWW57_004071 [Coemansia sp. S610]